MLKIFSLFSQFAVLLISGEGVVDSLLLVKSNS